MGSKETAAVWAETAEKEREAKGQMMPIHIFLFFKLR